MVGQTMRKALKKLEARTTKERKERSEKSKLAIIDPSHELSQQRQGSVTSASSQPCLHSAGLQSNPELHTLQPTWSSNASVYSFDSASVSSLSTSPFAGDDDMEEDPDMLPFDVQMRTFPTRRRSTGSSRAKSQQKLARILGWNTSFPQWKPPTSHFSSENLKSSSSSTKQNPLIWEDYADVSTPDSMPDLKMRQYPTRRANSMREYSTTPASHSDFQLRQFLSTKPSKDSEKPRRPKVEEERAESSRSITPTRRNSNPNVHKPLPTPPAFPTFPSAPPLQDTTPAMTSTSTPTSGHPDEFLPSFELSAEEASILLSQPEPTELATETTSGRAELSDPSTLLDPNSVTNVRSKSPTNTRSGSASSQYPDFGPGTTLSIIEEEPFDADDLAKLKVYELPADSVMPSIGDQLGSSGSSAATDGCPGLSPSSSLSSRRMKVQEDETEAQLESQHQLVTVGSEGSRSNSLNSSHDSASTLGSDAEGEEIIVIFDRRSGDQTVNMSGKSFLALDEEDNEEDDDDNQTDTEESYRNSIQSGESRFTSTPISQALRTNFPEGDNSSDENETEKVYRRSTSADTTNTAYSNRTNSTTKTLITPVDPDFSTDLAKSMDWL